MKLKLIFVIFITSMFFISCGEAEIKDIKLENTLFKASGHSPAWQLAIDSNNGIHFHSNFGKIVTPNSRRIDIMDVAATSYSAKTEAGEIRVEIFKKQCIDSKATKEFKYEVRLHVKMNDDNDFTILKGCGDYHPDKRLRGKWELQSINEKKLNKDDFRRGLPFVQFDIDKLQISGYNGCNNFKGNFIFIAQDIFIKKEMMTTRMGCPQLDFEKEFLNLLVGHALKVSFDGNILKLHNGNIVFIFVKAE